MYDALYRDLGAPPAPTAFELTLAVPAPRTALPATVRWLTATGHPAGAKAAAPGGPMPGGHEPAVALPPVSHIAGATPIALDVFPPRPAFAGVAPGDWPAVPDGGAGAVTITPRHAADGGAAL